MVKGEKMTLVEQLRQRVRDTGIPLGLLSRKADVPQSVLHKFVHDGGGLNGATIDKLMRYLGLEVTEAKGARK
jgi:hypothetical protein